MIISRHLCLFSFSAAAIITAGIALAEMPGESLAGIWRVSDAEPSPSWLVKLGDHPAVPPEVLADLDDFNESLNNIPLEADRLWIGTSPDGKRFGFGAIDDGQPTGVWIWSDWRSASPVEFSDFTYFWFVSDKHVYLRHPPSGGITQSAVVNLDEPSVLYTLPGVAERTLVMTDAGRWASFATGTGGSQLIVGQLDSDQPNAGAEGAEIVDLPIAGRIDKLAWLRDGDFLVAEVRSESEEMPTLFVIRADDLSVVDSADQAWLFSVRGRTVGKSSFYGGIEGQRILATVSSDGELTWQDTELPKEVDGDERPATISRSGKYVLTYWDEIQWPDDVEGPVEVLRTEIRHTPLAEPEEPLPSWPTHEVDGEDVKPGRVWWFSWE